MDEFRIHVSMDQSYFNNKFLSVIVTEIQQLTNKQDWSHVHSEHPTDLTRSSTKSIARCYIVMRGTAMAKNESISMAGVYDVTTRVLTYPM